MVHKNRTSTRDSPYTKLEPIWQGPYTIIKIKPEFDTYTVHNPNGNLKEVSVHVSHLKPYLSNNAEKFPSREDTLPPPVSEDELGPRYEIERIEKHRIRYRKNQYLVKWAGYPVNNRDWLNKEDIDFTAVEEYW